MRNALEYILEAISYFLGGTFLLQITDEYPEINKPIVENFGYAFLIIGSMLAILSLPKITNLQTLQKYRKKIQECFAFPLFMVSLVAVIKTGFQFNVWITLIIFYVIVISYFYTFGKIITSNIRPRENIGRFTFLLGFSFLLLRLVGFLSNVQQSYDLVLLYAGIPISCLGLILYYFIDRNYSKNSNNSWLSKSIQDITKKRTQRPSSSQIFYFIQTPNILVILLFALFFALCFLLSRHLFENVSQLHFLTEPQDLQAYFLTILQVQTALASFALPLLLVISEYSKDQSISAIKRS